jgi:hypothetical protein
VLVSGFVVVFAAAVVVELSHAYQKPVGAVLLLIVCLE